MAEPMAGVPAWHADPSGRHQYRWWDGQAYTDQVADNGVVATDTGAATAPPLPRPQYVPAQPLEPLSPTFGAGAAPVPTKARKAPLVLAVLVAAAAASAVGFVVLRDDGGSSGTGTFDSSLGDDRSVGVHEVDLRAGSALTIELDPGRDLDAVIGLVVADDDADRLEDLYDDVAALEATSLPEAFTGPSAADLDDVVVGDQVVFRTDVGFAGDEEILLLVAPFDIEVEVVVAPFEAGEADEGDYEIAIDTFTLDAGDDDEVEDLLEAVEDDDEIPAQFRELAAEQLDLS